ncbi:protein FAM219A-like [Amphiura filiformis]|uniref:protein FAM219A-like n=1 Tax=Amphiura filiformis TaxID=82378 RepID=UPI003B228E2B
MDNKYEGGGGINRGKRLHFYSIMQGMDEDETDSGYTTSANDQMKVVTVSANGDINHHQEVIENETHSLVPEVNGNDETTTTLRTLRKPSSLQLKIERQREAARQATVHVRVQTSPYDVRERISPYGQTSPLIDQQPRRSGLIAIDRLAVPWKPSALDREPSEQPLVSIDSESEDEFDVIALSSAPSQTTQDLRQQLLKDGYRLDEVPDDEELDLIPPRPMNERCVCCQAQTNCVIQ